MVDNSSESQWDNGRSRHMAKRGKCLPSRAKWSGTDFQNLGKSTSQGWLVKHRFDRAAIQPCRFCRSQDVRDIISLNTEYPPPIIAFGLEDHSNDGGGSCQPKLTAQVTIGDSSRKVTYKSRGLIYWDKSHFTWRMIGKVGEVYYNDGITTGTSSIHEGKLSEIKDLYQTRQAILTYLILSLV